MRWGHEAGAAKSYTFHIVVDSILIDMRKRDHALFWQDRIDTGYQPRLFTAFPCAPGPFNAYTRLLSFVFELACFKDGTKKTVYARR